jgi:hypothetical protein
MEAEPSGVGSLLELLEEQALRPEIASTAVAAMAAILMELRMRVPLFVKKRIPHCGGPASELGGCTRAPGRELGPREVFGRFPSVTKPSH